jgi:hypothetical protein
MTPKMTREGEEIARLDQVISRWQKWQSGALREIADLKRQLTEIKARGYRPASWGVLCVAGLLAFLAIWGWMKYWKWF